MDNLVSIIIPAYNIEKYILDCLKCIQNQTYKEIEVVIVDDGSTDNTGTICDNFCKKDKRFSVIHQSNHGQAYARNIARHYIHGDYLTYIDGDDVVHPEMVQCLVYIQKQTKADVVQGVYVSFNDKTYNRKILPILNRSIEYNKNHIEVYSPQEALNEFLYAKKFLNGPCGKLIKSDLMMDLEFPVNRGYEDAAIMYRLYGKSSRLVYVSSAIYFYRQRDSSTMHLPFNQKKLDRLSNAEELKEYIIKNFPDNTKALNYRYCMSMLQVLMWLPFDDEYREVRKNTYNNLKSRRIKVITDQKAPFKLKCMLIFSYFGVIATMILGRVYRLATDQ